MQRSKDLIKKKSRGCKALCCSCRISVSSSEEAESSSSPDRFESISSIAHAMVQERLDQMIIESRNAETIRPRERTTTKFVVMVATEMSTYDPREDFRESMEQMIAAGEIHRPKDLRRLLNYYLAMNSEDFQGIILEVFHDVCTRLFLYCRRH